MRRVDVTSMILVLSVGLVSACAGGAHEPAAPGAAQTSDAPEPDPNAPPRGELHGGSLAPIEVKKALVARKPDVRPCYRALLEKDKTASGRVVLRFTVAEDGTVEETVILSGTTLPDETARCIADVLKTTQFPKPKGGKARITYPWEFTTN